VNMTMNMMAVTLGMAMTMVVMGLGLGRNHARMLYYNITGAKGYQAVQCLRFTNRHRDRPAARKGNGK
jgi:hypothetical protein